MNLTKTTFLLLLCFIMPYLSSSQSYQQVKELAPGSDDAVPQSLANINGQLLYKVFNEDNNRNELWVTDGTEANTQMILDGFTSGFESSVRVKTQVNHVFYFYWTADNSIYSYDGQTLQVVVSDTPVHRINWFNGALYYIESDLFGASTSRLMKATSDPAAPELIKDLEQTNMQGLMTYNGMMIIMSGHNDNTWLYTSDGTTLGTTPFHELGLDSHTNLPPQFLEHNGELYFYYRSNGLNGSPPPPVGWYKTNGTSVGTIRLSDIYNGEFNLLTDMDKRFRVSHNDILYTSGRDHPDFNVGDELWASDGTIAGTRLVENLNNTNSSSSPRHFVVYNNEVYFSALKQNGRNAIWKTDGTEEGTFPILEDVFSVSGSYYGDWLTVYDGKLAFGAYHPDEGSELWLSDGTAAGTAPATNENVAGQNAFQPNNLFVVDHLLYFGAWVSGIGRELWVYDSETGTLAIDQDDSKFDEDENNSNDLIVFPNPSSGFVQVKDPKERELHFTLFDARGQYIWSQDNVNTIDLQDLQNGLYFLEIQQVGSRKLFVEKIVLVR